MIDTGWDRKWTGSTAGRSPVSSPPPFIRQRHEWDALRAFATVHANNHESVYRSYQVLRTVEAMLERGDSVETVLALITFAYATEKEQT